jgi:biopolymer transport protein ExbD
MIRGRNRHDEDASFDLTSMIDVVMLLIVFFTLTAQFSGHESASVDLPRTAGVANAQQQAAVVFLDVNKDGKVTSLGHDIDLADVVKQVMGSGMLQTGNTQTGAIASTRTQTTDIVIRADRQTKAKHINGLALRLRSAGITRWKFATTGEDSAVPTTASSKGAP